MQNNLPEMMVQIPAELNSRVEGSLKEVKRLYCRRVVRRIGTACGGVAVAVGAVFLLGVMDPALAAQIPIIGRLFSTVNADSKVYGPANLDDVAVAVNQKAESTNENCELSAISAYSDGRAAQISFRLDFKGELSDRYRWIDTQYGAASSVTVNGVPVEQMQMNSFNKLEGEWVSTMNFTLPEEVKGADRYEVQLLLGGFSGTLEDDGLGQDEEPPEEAIDVEFSLRFPLFPDLEHQFEFACDAQDNGARVTAVSGTRSETVITIEKPYWGEIFPNADPSEPDVYPKGFPKLYFENGDEVPPNANATFNRGGYDPRAREAQTACLYYDGVPEGTEKLILRFVAGDIYTDVLAEFTIDLLNQTVTGGAK